MDSSIIFFVAISTSKEHCYLNQGIAAHIFAKPLL